MNASPRDPGRGADAQREVAGTAEEAAESERQRALLGALFAARAVEAEALAAALDGEGDVAAGLRAYRSNAHASAERALAVTFPTLRALIGAEDFAQLAREFWHARPPQRGDLGDWGDALPAWLAAHAALAAWPYLADCARLDLALHRCERARDAAIEAASFALLGEHAPGALRLRLSPGVQCLTSRWPIVTLHAAHAAGADAALFERARAQIEAGEGDAAVVARDGFRAVVHRIGAPGAAFMQAVALDARLSDALTAAGAGFDFAAWLADALRCRWLQRVERCEG
jgi:hypothetical protein